MLATEFTCRRCLSLSKKAGSSLKRLFTGKYKDLKVRICSDCAIEIEKENEAKLNGHELSKTVGRVHICR